ncbi:LysR substrate-binding domain-containing protein [Celeribacter sp.]|uniref:LysR family transcriptional regulator n=1 Tax=Celeribacter sp. TaxID=1890673 RepID=UPI003A8ED5C5
MSFDLKTLELFVRVATLGAIGRAGEEFGMSPTNASQRIKSLETELGVKLLNRTTRAVSLTPDGEVLLENAKRILDDVEDLRTVLTHTAQSVSGHLRVTASASFGRAHIIPYVPEFMRLYPNVTLDLNLTDTVVDIVEQGYDMAFRIGALPPSSLLAQKIDDNPSWLVASPAYLERAGTPQLPEDLTRHACLTLGKVQNWHLTSADGRQYDVQVGGPLSVNFGDAIGEWVVAGMGIALASLWHAGPDLEAGRLVRVLPDYDILPRSSIWAVRPPGRLMPARVHAFMSFMQAKIIATNKARYGALM